MADIDVTRIDDTTFRVTVEEGGGRSVHEVTATAEQAQRYGGEEDVEGLIRESFEFLLEREPKESILARFELPVIEKYFPDYPGEIRRRLG